MVSMSQTWLGKTQPPKHGVSMVLRAGHEDRRKPVLAMLFLRGEQTSPLKWWLWSWDTKGTLLLHILCFTGKSIIQGAKTSIFRQICWASPKGISNAKCHTAVTIYPHEKWHWNCQLLGDPRGSKPVPKPVNNLVPFLLQLDKTLLPSYPTKLFCNMAVQGRKSPLPHPTSNSRNTQTEVPHRVNLAGNMQENCGIPSVKAQDIVVCACSKTNNILKHESLL